MDRNLEQLILDIYGIGAFKLGSFRLKSGILSPFYIDLRVIISHPRILKSIADLLWLRAKGLTFQRICGVPYTALPIASVMSVAQDMPMLMRRKEPKKYGTGKQIEGDSHPGETCLVIEDLVTSGLSISETVRPLAKLGVKVTDVVAVLDREQGGRANLAGQGIQLHSLITITQLVQVLVAHGKIKPPSAQKVQTFVAANQIGPKPKKTTQATPAAGTTGLRTEGMRMTFQQRANLSRTAVGRRLLTLMHQKQTNLCVSADVTTAAELLRLADEVGPYICVLKTHIDILTDFSPSVWRRLRALAVKHGFLLFEDRKYADIGNTVKMQFQQGVYKTSQHVDLVNAHVVAGPGIIDGLKAGLAAEQEVGLLLLAQMSSKGSLCTGAYTQAAVRHAEANTDFVMGFIAQEALSQEPGLITMTPGVKLTPPGQRAGDALGQQYKTPASVMAKGTDVIIVGRGITQAAEGAANAARRYRDAAWAGYLSRVQHARL